MVVRMRHTKSKTRRRRANVRLNGPSLTNEGGVTRLRHRASRTTGMYRGKRVLDVAKDLEKKKPVSEKEATEKK